MGMAGCGKWSRAGVLNLQDLMLEDLRWSWCNNNRNKVHNKSNALESSWNHPLPLPPSVDNCLPQNWSLMSKSSGTIDEVPGPSSCAWVGLPTTSSGRFHPRSSPFFFLHDYSMGRLNLCFQMLLEDLIKHHLKFLNGNCHITHDYYPFSLNIGPTAKLLDASMEITKIFK